MRMFVLILAVAAMATASLPQTVSARDTQSCVNREMAKGRSACIAKAKCNGVTSRKEQARLCGGG